MRDKLLMIVTSYYSLLDVMEIGWLCWSVLNLKEKAIVALITPFLYLPWLFWTIEIHYYHKRLVREGKAKREWFSGLLW